MTGPACQLCAAPLHRVAVPGLDEWGWADEAGRRLGDDPDVARLKPDPWSYLAALGRRCVTGTGKARRPDLAAAGEYTMLRVRLETRGTTHEHYPAELPAYDGPPGPEHCGRPARLRPSGWQCRQCGTALAAERAA